MGKELTEVVNEGIAEFDARQYLREYVIEWFKSRFEEFTPPQLMAIPRIKEGKNVLISSPTGTRQDSSGFPADNR